MKHLSLIASALAVLGLTACEKGLEDEEGMQTMRTLARNMAWMIRGLDADSNPHPVPEPPLRTNFIR